jgi:hypothetical protein
MTAPVTISWLELEQHALGTLDEARTARVEAAIAGDEALQARYDALLADNRAVPALPDVLPADSGLPLPAAAPALQLAAAPPPALEQELARPPRRWGALAGFAMAAAAALALVVLPDGGTARLPPAQTRHKGADLALRIDRERGGQVVRGVEGFSDGDRLSVRLTCAPGARTWVAAVFQGGERSTPLGDGGAISCGNDTPLPGAFTADGEALSVCVAVDGTHALRERPGPHATGVVCQVLRPE